MVQDERLKEILSILEEKHVVSVEELKKQLYVSTSTVRRDLTTLASRGLILRSSGGAIAPADQNENDPLIAELNDTANHAAAIGRRAAELVKPGNCIFLSASAVILPLAGALLDKNLTVVTDSMDVTGILCNHAAVNCCSGRYQERSNSFAGPEAVQFVSYYNYDTAFFSCGGLTQDGILTYSSLEKLNTLEAAIRNARSRVLLCEQTKLGRCLAYNLLESAQVDIIVTDAPESALANFAGQVISIGG